ncbi:MAG TPA: M2 family metallopeptidase [Candidatus Acidoferrales bacterium]|nr:M2 family metallopeptidase [Candidatus Acidoferrales bacterium]
MTHPITSRLNSLAATGFALFLIGLLALPGITSSQEKAKQPAKASTAAKAPAPAKAAPGMADARAFTDRVEKRLFDLSLKYSQADWVAQNFITDDTEALSADANEQLIAATTEFATQATRFDKLKLPAEVERKLLLLKLSLTLPAPKNEAERSELAKLVPSMQGDYGKGKWCPQGDKEKCLDLNALSRIMAESRDPKQLLDVWRGWHAISPPMRKRYTRYVELANKGARELGFADMGAMWRSKYDMPPDAFAQEVDRLWLQVKPLYDALHAHVRAKLREKYGAEVVPESGPIPAHLLGNMWAQEWSNIYPLVAPSAVAGTKAYDLTEILKARKTDEKEMVRTGERFFTSLGFAPLPKTFWERSLFTKPRDRDVVCHASAWSIDFKEDLRLKMCIEITEEDFRTIHHELGHNFYQRAYNKQPVLFQDSANDGFHEAVGDTIALSITPEYLKQIGLIENVPGVEGDLGYLMKVALDKVAFLPFGLLIDQWRWKVFSGEIKPTDYNKTWWELRRKYQGVAPPVARSEADFDPGAKYHVAANVPYTRYFLAHILQFQFYRAMCRAAGFSGPLHRCSFYNNKAAGAKLNKMLAMGLSRPWPEALEALTGEKQIDARAMLDYFAPLKKWLDEQNKGRKVGW